MRIVVLVLASAFLLGCGVEQSRESAADRAPTEVETLPIRNALERAARCVGLDGAGFVTGEPSLENIMQWTALITLDDTGYATQLASQWGTLLGGPEGASLRAEARANCANVVSYAELVVPPSTVADFPVDPVERSGACGQVLAMAAARLGDTSSSSAASEMLRRYLAFEMILEGDGADVQARKRAGERWYQAYDRSGEIFYTDFRACSIAALAIRPN